MDKRSVKDALGRRLVDELYALSFLLLVEVNLIISTLLHPVFSSQFSAHITSYF